MLSPIRWLLAPWILAAAVALPAAAAGPAITIYTRDLGFVRETRTLDLRGSRDTVRIEDVPERLDFSSVRLSPAGSVRVARLAYRFDVASGDGLLERARGGKVRVALRGDRSIDGTLVAVDGSWLTVREDQGFVHTLSRGSIDDVRLLTQPEGLALKPALEAVLEAERRGRVEAELAYLTGGLSWSAEHVLVRNGESRATWSSEVAVENLTGRDFADARLKLIAGEPNRTTSSLSPMPRMAMMEMATVAGKSADLSEESFSEYHLYSLDRPALLRDRETQRLTMLEPRGVSLTPRYLYRGGDARGVRAQLETANTAANGLGVPLPGGRVRIYQADPGGDLQFVGESSIRHTAEGEKFTLEVGTAFDLAAERRELYNKRITDREREYAVEIKLRNRKKTGVSVVVEEGAGGDIEITQKSHPFVRKDANTLEFNIPVAAGQEVALTYTARVRY